MAGLTLFEGLLIAHVLGDWIFQTEWQAENKARQWLPLLVHVLIYHAIVLAVLLFGFGLRSVSVLVAVVVLAVIHVILDRRSFTIWLMRSLRITVNREPERWLLLAVDQSLHLITLAGAAVYLAQ